MNKEPINNQDIRLTIELVPKTCWFSNLRSQLNSSDWDKLRKMTYQQAKYHCEICGGCGDKWAVECHECWQYDDQKHIQTLSRLIALCPACHEVKHMGLARVRRRGHIAEQHLAKVNGWTMEKTSQYVKRQFEIWRKRSKWNWRLDITWLEQQGITFKDRQPPTP